MAVKQTAGRRDLGEFAPKFAQLNDDVLFGEVWSREGLLSLRDRSLVTVVSLMAQGLVDSSFQYHLMTAKQNGITRTEIAEILTHAAFYAGWPKAWAAFRMAKEVWADEDDGKKGGMFGLGQPNDAYAQYFIGQSYLNLLTTEGVVLSNVTFEPGCRNNWHIHHADKGGGQLLLCTDGRGWYQEWGKEARALNPGDVVLIPAGVKHWHGAASDSWFSHLAMEVPGENPSNEWLEPVNDEEYGKLG
ncbi:gamma-carboxymuconolactone decarboxylase [Lachnoclostridium sp. An14]|uniref:carboxymuconolactone decarboxylase family protein n=1 Tax=Lachnoclostridium sp. An14 TaxID=1965562 RepID=UPI000B397097|nr:carboxymuconolactone decarboxylase family protein [Lachnoclostridium sp. An14]OUQ21103.1 gamma-carboxymuconolactone decarboxylase [Lachnoclostridium sp. An14]